MVRATGILAFLATGSLITFLAWSFRSAELRGTIVDRPQSDALSVLYPGDPFTADYYGMRGVKLTVEELSHGRRLTSGHYLIWVPDRVLRSFLTGDELRVSSFWLWLPGWGPSKETVRFELLRESRIVVREGRSPAVLITVAALLALSPILLWVLVLGWADRSRKRPP